MSQLLVSVRSVEEGEVALAAGVNYVDIKDPTRGSLGRASDDVINSIARQISERCPVSVALGELVDNSSIPHLPSVITYAKWGTSKLGSSSDWRSEYAYAAERFQAINPKIGLIAVAYVDVEYSRGPTAAEVLSFALENKFAGVLFDTFDKSKGSLLDWVPLANLKQNVETLKQSELLCALAGSLTFQSIQELISNDIFADIIAVRTLVCEHGDRNGPVSAERIQLVNSILNQKHQQGR